MIIKTPILKSQALLELHLFGTGEVWLEGRRLEVGNRKTLALLAYLALEGQTPRSVLADLFWSDYDDESARRNLRRELHRLREAGLRHQVLTVGEHLRLSNSVFTDVQDFYVKFENSLFAAALEVHQSGLLQGLRLENTPLFDAWLESKRAELIGLCNQARLRLAEDLETKGDWKAALALHQLVLKDDTLQERQHREVMRLHYLLGNREAALIQFEQCTAMLETELGLEPLPATVRLAQQIRAAQTLEPSTSLPFVASKALVVPLIGRNPVLKTLSSSLEPLVLLLGQAGIGKTVLLEKFAPEGLYFGFRQVSSQTPLYTIAEVLRGLLSNLEARVKFDQLPSIWQQETARLIPELADNQKAEPQERIVFLEGLARALECLNTWHQPLIFDDLHWADTASLEFMVHLVRRSKRENQPISIIATARPEELSSSTKLVLQQLEQDDLSKTVLLQALSKPEVQELVLALSGSDAPLFSNKLFAATTGNPLFILETIRYLFEQGQLETWENLETVPLSLPPSVRDAVLKRIDSAGSAVRRLLETAALTENGFTLETIQPATALNEWEGLEGLERAVSVQLLQRLETGFGFSHDLIRQALQNALSPERQRLIHSKLAITLEQSNANPISIALHLEQADKAVAAVPWRIKAAEAATRVYAHTLALEQYEKALKNGAPDELALEILETKLGIWEMLGQTILWQTDLEQMAFKTTKIPTMAAQSQLLMARIRFALHQRDFETAVRLATQVIEASVTNELIAQAHGLIGTALVQQSQLETAKNHLTQALDLLPENHVLRSKVLNQLFQVAVDMGNTELAEQHLASALHLNQSTQNLLDELGNLNNQGKMALNKGDNAAAESIFETALEKVKPINNPTLERLISMGLATAYSRMHRTDNALQLLEQALKLAKLTDSITAQGGIYHTIGAVYRRLTQFGKAVQYYQNALELADQVLQQPARIFRRLTLADLYLDLGHFKQAGRLIEETKSIIEETGVRTEAIWCQILLGKQQRLAGQIKTSLITLKMPAPSNPLDRIIWLTELALTQLAARQYTKVIKLLTGEDAPPNTMLQLLNIRLQALTALKKPFAKELHEIKALESELTPLFLLQYHQALARTHAHTQEIRLAKYHQDLARDQILNMASSLENYPDLTNSFFELHKT